jgi:hypothetical protein
MSDQPSPSIPEPSRRRPMQVVGERVIPDQPGSLASILATNQTSPTTTPPSGNALPKDPDFRQREYIHRAAWKAGVLGALNVLARVLSARWIVMMAVAGGILLTTQALANPDVLKLGVLAIYALGIVAPVVFLSARGQ